MSPFFYIVTEGVHDVTFIGKLLSHVPWREAADEVRRFEEFSRRSIEDSFKWPVKAGRPPP